MSKSFDRQVNDKLREWKANHCNVILSKQQHAPLLKLLNAVMFNGSHELPQEFWTQEEYEQVKQLQLSLQECKPRRRR